jgi:hypothetical protein
MSRIVTLCLCPCINTAYNRHTHYWNAAGDGDDGDDSVEHGSNDGDFDFSAGVGGRGAQGKKDDDDTDVPFQLPRTLAQASVKDDQWKKQVWDTLEQAERDAEAVHAYKKRPLSSGAAKRQAGVGSSSGSSGFQSAASVLAAASHSTATAAAAAATAASSLLVLPAKLFLHVPVAQREVGLKVLRDAAAQHRDAQVMLARTPQWEWTAASDTTTRQNYNLRIRSILAEMRAM